MFKAIVLCASALMVQSIAGQACGRISLPAPSCGKVILPAPSCGNVILPAPSCGSTVSVSNNGGSLIVTSVGPIAPSGIAVATDLALAGNLDLSGTLPFLSAVEFGTTLPTSGVASVSYGCGDGNIAITQEIGNPCGNNLASSSGLTAAQLGGCGCGQRY